MDTWVCVDAVGSTNVGSSGHLQKSFTFICMQSLHFLSSQDEKYDPLTQCWTGKVFCKWSCV